MLARVQTDRLDFERSPRQSYRERSYGHGFFDSQLQVLALWTAGPLTCLVLLKGER